ncbi:MAG: hypothetical protein JST28_09275 [Acidobacteria bacterium]|nr:hypothetical protein [Acidobacteriota bacterium]
MLGEHHQNLLQQPAMPGGGIAASRACSQSFHAEEDDAGGSAQADPKRQSTAAERACGMTTAGIRKPSGPVLVQEHTYCECGKLAMKGIFCLECWDQYTALEREYQENQARRSAPIYQARDRWRRQFTSALIIMLVGEGLWNTAIGVPIDFRSVGMAILWALVVAMGAASLDAVKKDAIARVMADALSAAQMLLAMVGCTVLLYWLWTGGR